MPCTDTPMLKIKTMKTNCWIGPLIAVILLLTLRQLQNEQQQAAIGAEKKEVLKNEVKGKETFAQISARLKS